MSYFMEYQRMRYDIFVLIIGLLGGFFSWWLGKDLIGFFFYVRLYKDRRCLYFLLCPKALKEHGF
jgi:hypothetical protein